MTMGKVKIAMVLFFNTLTLILGLAVFFVALNIANAKKSVCDVSYRSPFFSTGYLIIVMSIMGWCRICCRVQILRWIYLGCILAAIFAMVIMLGFGILVLGHGSGKVESRMIEQQVTDFSPWLQHSVNKRWSAISACLASSHICPSITAYRAEANVQAFLYPLQRGCCTPPRGCAHKLLNHTADRDKSAAPTPAARSSSSSSYNDYRNKTECEKWRDPRFPLCFSCETCKAGFMTELVGSWKRNFLMETGLLTCLILIFGISVRATFSHNGDNYNEEEESYRETVNNLPVSITVERLNMTD